MLIVEDDAHELGLALRAFKTTGIAVEVAHDGAEALARLLPPRLAALPRLSFVLLDLNLPKISGIDVARALKADPAISCIPIVVFSSSSEARDLAACYAAGVNSYIVKPVEFDTLLTFLANIARYWSEINRAQACMP